MKFVLYFLLTLPRIGRSEMGCCHIVDCHKDFQRNNGKVYFGLMLSYPDPLGRKALASGFDDGHDIAPAAYLAVEQINSRSDLLSDYQVELMQFDGGCTVNGRTAVGIGNLACTCEPVVGIVGPSCGTSALIIGEFTGKDRFSMVTIHYGERDILGDRNRFPFAFGMLGANFITIEAFTRFVIKNDWSRIVLLYSENDLDLSEVSVGLENNLKNAPGFDVTFTSPVYDYFIPLQEIQQSFSRVIIVLLSVEETLRTLCLAFHEGMVFPKYQWIFKERLQSDFTETSFIYKGKNYSCTEEDISASIYGSINFVWSLRSDNEDILLKYDKGYEKQRDIYTNDYNVTSVPVEWATGMYDAVWSLAFALNNSLKELNMNLAQVVSGSKAVAQAIANHMSDTDLQGVSGRIHFDKGNGFNTARRLNIYQYGAAKSNTSIGFYASEELVLFNDTVPQFIKATFNEKYIQVSTTAAVPILILTLAMLLFAVPIQALNIIYRNHSAIKATSPMLNHLIFLGCYLTIVGTVIYIVTEIWQHMHEQSSFCIAASWFISVGTSMIVGTACLKTWRLYRIYISSKKVLRLGPKIMADSVLGVAVCALALFDLLVCLIWTNMDPLQSMIEIATQMSKESELPVIVMTVTCQSRWLVYWVSVLVGYKCILTGCSTVLAMLTNIKKKEFRTKNIIILAYLLAITFGLGIPTYAIVSIIGVDVSVRFVILCVIIDTIMYVCLFALFFPSVFPLIREKAFKFKYVPHV